jgi:hypothetical protein
MPGQYFTFIDESIQKFELVKAQAPRRLLPMNPAGCWKPVFQDKESEQ